MGTAKMNINTKKYIDWVLKQKESDAFYDPSRKSISGGQSDSNYLAFDLYDSASDEYWS
jgi:hypothetical protein